MASEDAPYPFTVFARTGFPGDISALDRDICRVADESIAALNYAKSKPAAKEPNHLKPEDVRFLAYSLPAFRTRNDEALTENHLRLLAAALGVDRVPARAAEMFGIPSIRNQTKFLAAAECQACAPTISVRRHAAIAAVDRKTIRAWRKEENFESAVRAFRDSGTAGSGTRTGIDAFELSMGEVIYDLIADLLKPKRSRVTKQLRRFKPEDDRFVVYRIVLERTRDREPLTEDHLLLLASALGIKRVSQRVAEEIGLPPIKDMAKFLTAADLQAREPRISETKLAAAVGTDRKTIRVWRKLEGFNRRVRSIRCLEINRPKIAQFNKKFSCQ